MSQAFTHLDLGWSMGSFDYLFNEAKRIAELTNTKVSFSFNGVKVNMTKDSTLDYTWPLIQEAIKHQKLSAFGEGW